MERIMERITKRFKLEDKIISDLYFQERIVPIDLQTSANPSKDFDNLIGTINFVKLFLETIARYYFLTGDDTLAKELKPNNSLEKNFFNPKDK